MRLITLLAVLLLAPLSALATPYQAYPDRDDNGGDTFRVVTGDTLVLNGQAVRLAGIQAPAVSQICGRGFVGLGLWPGGPRTLVPGNRGCPADL